jgi:hypothetical protein
MSGVVIEIGCKNAWAIPYRFEIMGFRQINPHPGIV